MNENLKSSEIVDLLDKLFELCLKRKKEVFQVMGVNETEYKFFMSVRNYNDLNLLQIASRMDLPQSKISRIVDKMVKKRYLKREHKNSDMRSVRIALTQKGKELHEYAMEHKCIGEAYIKEILKDDKYEELKSLLKILVDNYIID